MVGVVGDADALGPGVFGVGLGAANALQTKFGNEWEKKVVLVSIWLKESY